MLRMLAGLGAKLKAVLGLFLPVYEKARGTGGMPGWLRVVLHVLVVAAIVAGLYWINNSFDWIRDAVIPGRWLARWWLPILILLVYVLAWLSYWLWKLLVFEEEGPYFADIDTAWEQAKYALHKAGIGLSEQPLFLILGQPEDDEKALFQAAQLTLEVGQTPADAEAPLHVYATRDATYVTCAGASLLGCHARYLAGKPLLGDDELPRPDEGNEDDDLMNRTLSPGAKGNLIPNKGAFVDVADMAKMFQRVEREGRPLNQLTKPEKRMLRAVYRKGNPERSPLKNPELIAYQAARLQFLCYLLARDRRPFVAANGVLLLIPFAGCDNDQDATFTAEALQRDIAIANSSLRVDCPYYALVCDMETANGFDEFVQHFKPKERLQRLGQRCPFNPDLRDSAAEMPSTDNVARMLDSLAKWLCWFFLFTWVYQRLQIEKADTPDRADLIRRNGQLFLLGDELQERSPRLGTILARGLAQKAAAGPLLFAGCYLAGTGSDAEREQAFVRGLLDKMDVEQSCVYWTRATLQEEASYSFWANIGWTVIGIVIVGVVVLLVRQFWP